MRNFKPPYLGDGWFDWVNTSPGRLHPETGELIETTVVPLNERQGMFDWLEVTPGRINPKTGKLVVPTTIPKDQRERLRQDKESEPRAFSRFSEGRSRLPVTPRFGMKEEPAMNGNKDMGCGECSEMGNSGSGDGPGLILWLFLGTAAIVGLEAAGITTWSKPKV